MLMVQKAVNASEGREVTTLQSPVSFELLILTQSKKAMLWQWAPFGWFW